MRYYYVLLGFLIIGFTACQEKMMTNEFGVSYKLIEEGSGDPVEDGKVMESLVNAYVYTNDSLVQQREANGQFAYNQMNFAQAKENPIMSIMKDRKVGDSLMIEMPYTEKTKKFMPPTAKESTVVKYFVKVTRVETPEENKARRMKEMEEKQLAMQKQQEEQMPKDDEIIQKYLADNSLEAEKTESGLYYVITESKESDKPQAGDRVEVNYKGYLLSGDMFDQSRGKPFGFQIGTGQVIQGWDEGIALLGKGDKATLLIPSHLAYGFRGAGAKIPPFAVLRFEVELVDFSTPEPKK